MSNELDFFVSFSFSLWHTFLILLSILFNPFSQILFLFFSLAKTLVT